MAMGNLVKVIGWYDNEWGYSCRVVDLIKKDCINKLITDKWIQLFLVCKSFSPEDILNNLLF